MNQNIDFGISHIVLAIFILIAVLMYFKDNHPFATSISGNFIKILFGIPFIGTFIVLRWIFKNILGVTGVKKIKKLFSWPKGRSRRRW